MGILLITPSEDALLHFDRYSSWSMNAEVVESVVQVVAVELDDKAFDIMDDVSTSSGNNEKKI